MTFYLHPYPYRQLARRAVQNREHSLGINIHEEDDAYVLSALVPGLKAEDLNIQVLDDVVRIEGEYTGRRRTTISCVNFPPARSPGPCACPSVIDADQVEARIADGMLTLTLPKAESARPKRISIKSR